MKGRVNTGEVSKAEKHVLLLVEASLVLGQK